MGKQGWEWCGSVPDKDGMTKIILKRYAPVVRRKSPTVPPNPESSLGVSPATKTKRVRKN
jgi:hypothetical protein